jgi:hypothetical protein
MSVNVVNLPEISMTGYAETKELTTSRRRFCTRTMVPYAIVHPG